MRLAPKTSDPNTTTMDPTIGTVFIYEIPRGHGFVWLQMEAEGAWPTAAVVTAKWSLDGANFYAFSTSVMFTAKGGPVSPATNPTRVAEGGFLSLTVSTVSADTRHIVPFVNAIPLNAN